ISQLSPVTSCSTTIRPGSVYDVEPCLGIAHQAPPPMANAAAAAQQLDCRSLYPLFAGVGVNSHAGVVSVHHAGGLECRRQCPFAVKRTNRCAHVAGVLPAVAGG